MLITETITKANTLSRRRLKEEHTKNSRKQQMTRKPTELFSAKHTTKIGTWNVRTLYQSGKCAQAAKEMDRYKIEILGLSEVRWNSSGLTSINSSHTIVYSGNTNLDDPQEKGVAFLMTRNSKKALLEWNPISSRIITARFNSRFQNTTIIQVYAPTNNTEKDDKEDQLCRM